MCLGIEKSISNCLYNIHPQFEILELPSNETEPIHLNNWGNVNDVKKVVKLGCSHDYEASSLDTYMKSKIAAKKALTCTICTGVFNPKDPEEYREFVPISSIPNFQADLQAQYDANHTLTIEGSIKETRVASAEEIAHFSTFSTPPVGQHDFTENVAITVGNAPQVVRRFAHKGYAVKLTRFGEIVQTKAFRALSIPFNILHWVAYVALQALAFVIKGFLGIPLVVGFVLATVLGVAVMVAVSPLTCFCSLCVPDVAKNVWGCVNGAFYALASIPAGLLLGIINGSQKLANSAKPIHTPATIWATGILPKPNLPSNFLPSPATIGAST